MSINKIPIRTVYDGSDNPTGLAEFQTGETVPISHGGTAADTVSNAKINLQLTDSNIRNLFSVTGGGSYDSATGVVTIDSTDLTPFAKTVDLTTANVNETTNLYYNNARVDAYINESITTTDVSEGDNLYYTIERSNTAIDARVTKSFIDNLGVDATTLDGIDSDAFALDTDLTTANVIENTNLYFTESRARLSVSAEGSINYNNSTGVFSFTQGNTDTISEGETNLYFTNARVDAYINESITTTDVSEGDNLYFTFDRARASLVSNAISIGELTVTGNLFVEGDTVQINTATLTVEDKNILLANGAATAEVADGAGITVAGADATIIYVSDGDLWRFNKGANVLGAIAATGTITSPFFYSESDSTLKDNIEPITNALDVIKGINGVKYVWKRSQLPGVGVIAQDVEKVLPEIVAINNAGSKTVSYDSLVAVLIEAVKEQQKQIEELKAKIK